LNKKNTSKHWLLKRKKDKYFSLSKIQGYRSRSAFKLIEMNNKYKFIKKDTLLLDLGSSPGGWSQVANKEIKTGKILAIDIKDMEKLDSVNFIKCDFQEKRISEMILKFFNGKLDVVLSDMAANTTGNKTLDSYRTGELCLNALDLSAKILRDDGIFLSKIFMGKIYNEINEKAKNTFKKVVKYKPLSSKKESKEIYIFCKGLLKI